MAIKTIKFEVIADFPWSMHDKGEIIEVYETNCISYVVQCPDGYGGGESDKFDLRDFPEIYKQIK
jgi:hypothetical protein